MPNEILPHQQRVVDELAQLSTKIEGLNAFINFSESFPDLPSRERMLLRDQLEVMKNYASLLDDRLLLWGLVI